jgi:hypothetical protein
LQLLIKASEESAILKIFNHFNNQIPKYNSNYKNNLLHAFERMLDELQRKSEDVIVNVVNSFVPTLLQNIKAVCI